MVASVGATAKTESTTSMAVTWPSTGEDYLALLQWSGSSGVTWTPPSGWTVVAAVVGDTGTHESRLYYRVCDGTETGSVTLTHSAINKQAANIVVYSGTHPTDPIDDYTTRDESVSGTTHANPAVTTGFPNCVIVALASERTTGSGTYTVPSTYTQRAQPTPLGAGGSVSVCFADDGLASGRASGTTVTPGDWTSTATTANVITWTVSIRPAEPSTGDIVYGRDWPPTVMATDDTVQANIADTSYVTGTPEVGVYFRSPPSGRVVLTVGGATRDNTNGNRAFVAPQVYLGDANGTAVLAADVASRGFCAPGASSAYMYGSRSTLLEGLSPGQTYYARCAHSATTTTSASADIALRYIIVEPAS